MKPKKRALRCLKESKELGAKLKSIKEVEIENENDLFGLKKLFQEKKIVQQKFKNCFLNNNLKLYERKVPLEDRSANFGEKN